MLKFKLLALPLTLLLSGTVLNGCSQITVKDKEVCADLGVVGAHCAHTFITQRSDLTKADWDKRRIGWMCMSADDFSDTEDSVDELCRTTNMCDYATAAKIQLVKANMAPGLLKAKAVRASAPTPAASAKTKTN